MLLAGLGFTTRLRATILFAVIIGIAGEAYSQSPEEPSAPIIGEQVYPLLMDATKGLIGTEDIVTIQYYVAKPLPRRTIAADTSSIFAISRIIMESHNVFSTIFIGTISLPYNIDHPLIIPVVIEHNRLNKLTAEQRELLVSVAPEHSSLKTYFKTWCIPLGITSSYHAN